MWQIPVTNSFPSDPIFDPEIIVDGDLSGLSDRTSRLYRHWILDLSRGRTFFGLNYEWPSNRWHRNLTIPQGFYDTYVFSWGNEDWDHQWLRQFCVDHNDSEVIVISDTALPPGYYDLPNLRCLVHHCWHVLLTDVISYDRTPFVPVAHRTWRCSSLVNKPSYFKVLTTAYLMLHYRDCVLMSWNTNRNGEMCGSIGFLDPALPTRSELVPLIDFYHRRMKSVKLELDEFVVDRMQLYNSNHAAFTDCVVNLTDETFSQDAIDEVPMPGPYITEKTWKPLLAGTALLPQGRSGTYAYMENFGFVFDYPWNRRFDTVTADIDRFVQGLRAIDRVFEMPMQDLAQAVAESCKHNYYHIRSEQFKTRVQNINDQHLQIFLNQHR